MKHTLIALLATFVIFIIGYMVIENKTRNALPIEYSCTFLSKDTCIIPSKSDEIKKADMSNVDQSKYITGENVIYKVENSEEQYKSDRNILIVVCFFLFLIFRFGHYIFRIDALGNIDFD